MAWLSSTLAVGCLAVGVLHVLRLVVLGRDRAAEVSYAAMGVGMAAMFSPFGDPVPAALWTTVFLLIGVWFVARALRAGNLAGDAAHHILGSASMLFMLQKGLPTCMLMRTSAYVPGTGTIWLTEGITGRPALSIRAFRVAARS